MTRKRINATPRLDTTITHILRPRNHEPKPRDEPESDVFEVFADGEFEIDVDTLASLREEGESENGSIVSTIRASKVNMSDVTAGDVNRPVSTSHD